MNKYCIICEQVAVMMDYDDKPEMFHPMDGTHFITYGHYGSTVFDPVIDGTHLDILICNSCLENKKQFCYGNGVKHL
jgi:hypothetical protein